MILRSLSKTDQGVLLPLPHGDTAGETGGGGGGGGEERRWREGIGLSRDTMFLGRVAGMYMRLAWCRMCNMLNVYHMHTRSRCVLAICASAVRVEHGLKRAKDVHSAHAIYPL